MPRGNTKAHRSRSPSSKWNQSGCFPSGGILSLLNAGINYSAEPATLVALVLAQVANGVMLSVTESGFDRNPLARRAKAFTENEQGRGMVVKLAGCDYLARTLGLECETGPLEPLVGLPISAKIEASPWRIFPPLLWRWRTRGRPLLRRKTPGLLELQGTSPAANGAGDHCGRAADDFEGVEAART